MARLAVLPVSIFVWMLTASNVFAAGPFGSIHVGNWNGGAYTDNKTGTFSHCAASTSYVQGITLTLSQHAAGDWLLSFLNPSWQLKPSETFSMDVTYDGQAQYHLFGAAATSTYVIALLPSPSSIDQFGKAHLMVAVVKGQTYGFKLASTSQLLAAIANCTAKMKVAGVDRAGDFAVGVPKPAAAAAVQPAAGTATPAKPQRMGELSGTGFAVSADGYVITNNHVISGCVGDVHGNVTNAGAVTLRIVSKDETNDLALLQAPLTFQTIALVRANPIHSGEAVVAIGYPFHGLLSSDFTVTTGIVSSLSGILNDTRFLQTSAPAQPGNSGGPLFDMSGNLVGIVAAKLNAIKFAKLVGTIPENINFAIKVGAARDFLDNSVVPYRIAESTADLKAADIANNARAYVMRIWCTGKE